MEFTLSFNDENEGRDAAAAAEFSTMIKDVVNTLDNNCEDVRKEGSFVPFVPFEYVPSWEHRHHHINACIFAISRIPAIVLCDEILN